MDEIVQNNDNPNISRYGSTTRREPQVDLAATHAELVKIEDEVRSTAKKHNNFLKKPGLPVLPYSDHESLGEKSV